MSSSNHPSLNRKNSLRDYLSSIATRTKLPSIRSRKSTTSLNSQFSYAPYAVHQQSMAPIILRDADATNRLLECILESPGGRKALARLARTCKAFKDPALDLLWKDLDSFVPLVSLFPNSLMKRAKKPGLGLAKHPQAADWEKVLAYAERVQSIQYVQAFNNVAIDIFPILAACPREYLLPNLKALTWKAENLQGLMICRPYLTTKLESFTLEMGVRAPKVNDFLDEVMSKTKLTSFSFTLHSNIPENFVEKVQTQTRLEKLALMLPGVLTAKIGKWASTLPLLRTLQLDLTNAGSHAVDNFFNDISPGSGYSTPSSVSGSDSGIFSGEDEIDFSEFRKSAARLTSDGPRLRPFAHLTQVNLTGEAGNVAKFLRHVTSPLTQLDLAIEDPPELHEWRELCMQVSDGFGSTLQTLRVMPTSTARYAELVRSTSRGGEVQLRHLTLEHFGPLPRLQRFEIELPESAIFHNVDVAHLARACPDLEVVRLCGQARFPPAFGPPYLTLEGIIPLTSRCKRLHTLAVVVNALDGRDETYRELELSSRALVRLNVGHSWCKNPLETAILISHIAPHLDSLKWFSPSIRAGSVESHAAAWQKVNDYLPPMQRMRLIERSLLPKPIILPPPPKVDKQVDATPRTISRGVLVKPAYTNQSTQIVPPLMIETGVECLPETSSVEIDATPRYVTEGVDAMPQVCEQGIDAVPDTEDRGIDVLEEESASSDSSEDPIMSQFSVPPLISTFTPSLQGIITLPMRAVRIYTYYLTFPVRYMLSFTPLMSTPSSSTQAKLENGSGSSSESDIEEVSENSMHSMSSSTSIHETHAVSNQNASTDVSPDTSPESENICHESESTQQAEMPVRERVFYFASELAGLPKWARSDAHVGLAQGGKTPMRQDATRQSQQAGLGHSTTASFAQTWFTTPIHFRRYDMADPKKQEKDYTAEVDSLLPETRSLAESGKLDEAIEKLLVLEKQTRNASDLSSTTRLVKEIAQLSYDARNYTLLNHNIQLLSKKHGQLKAAIQALVELAIGWLPEIKERDGLEKWLELIETLRTVTEGKIFLETPRARVTLLLAHHHESLANSPTPTSPPPKESKQTASDLLSELQVETYSSMERREKTEFILEQMRLLIAVAREKDGEKGQEGQSNSIGGGEADWVKVRVAGRKVNEAFLTQKENEDLKLKYYDLMIQYALQHSEYLDATKYYYKVWETPTIKAETTGRGKEALEHIVYYIVLAPHDNEQSDMLHRLFRDPALQKLELHYALVKCFTTPELMRWPGIEAIYGPHLRATSVFSSDKLWEDLHTRVIEHNIRIVAQYYTRITLARLTDLLDLSVQQTEETLSRLVVSKSVWARIDRPAGIINFRQARTAEDVMNDWSSDMSKLLGLIEKTWMGVNAAQAAQARGKA